MTNARRFAGAFAALAIAVIATLPLARQSSDTRAGGGHTPPTPACAHDLTGCRR